MSSLPSIPPAQFGFSGTLKGIYVIRYLLFSLGTAVAGALIQRAFKWERAPILGLGLGLAAGLVLFRAQLRPLSWPSLILSESALYFRERGSGVRTVPWPSVRGIEERDGVIQIVGEEGSRDPISLEPRKLGTSKERLREALDTLVKDPSARAGLPADKRVRTFLGLDPV